MEPSAGFVATAHLLAASRVQSDIDLISIEGEKHEIDGYKVQLWPKNEEYARNTEQNTVFLDGCRHLHGIKESQCSD